MNLSQSLCVALECNRNLTTLLYFISLAQLNRKLASSKNS